MRIIPLSLLIFSTISLYAQNPRIKPSPTNPGAKKTTTETTTSPAPSRSYRTPTAPANTEPANNTPAAVASPISNTETSSPEPLKNNVIFNFGGILGLPHGEFKDISNNWGYGISAKLAYNPFHSLLVGEYVRPFLLGLEVQHIWFGAKTENYSQTEDFYVNDIESRVSSGALGIGLSGRCEFLSYKFYPFIEYSAGFRFFSGSNNVTITKTPRPNVQGNITTDNASRTLEASTVGYYGFGGGLGFSNGHHFRFELKLNYQYGGNATYIDPESVAFDANNRISYKTKSSKTDMFIPFIGCSFLF
ncbi:MAG: hypothetical protein ACK445_06795 [Bacteroidota bacterium]|jgi:hypothetical protein